MNFDWVVYKFIERYKLKEYAIKGAILLLICATTLSVLVILIMNRAFPSNCSCLNEILLLENEIKILKHQMHLQTDTIASFIKINEVCSWGFDSKT